ncbi:DUF6559 family protein [Neptuniibacter caesariensis]|uniref:Uncharacterized protein n=1 Tax=Neptuniibacter caesariensis TaxID=207954 RepID=A0A7U8C158_NEPCE|nr:DUF6559 family protein [Neptuniibacter caesariensis]EAR59628.1 hypothetical protein MED92_00165 [Oceanospirillum sp. MED92] [Neptuniibacter caesariensis]
MINILERITRWINLRRYIRQLPFYLMREYGVKKYYDPQQVDRVAVHLQFDINYVEFGYAVDCDNRKSISEEIAKIRREYQRIYKLPADFTIFNAIRLSQYKDNWVTSAQADGEEYWRYLSQVEALEKNEINKST